MCCGIAMDEHYWCMYMYKARILPSDYDAAVSGSIYDVMGSKQLPSEMYMIYDVMRVHQDAPIRQIADTSSSTMMASACKQIAQQMPRI